jgi:outer membrane receptor protein involved in Fe transport
LTAIAQAQDTQARSGAAAVSTPVQTPADPKSAVRLAEDSNGPATPVLEEEPAAVQEVVVTGSRIQVPAGMTTPTPVTAVTADDLNKIAPGNLANALTTMPSFYNSQNASVSTSSGVSKATGSNLNLRGLGTDRTLVLLDGRRVVPNNKTGAINIDIFPQELIKRVDTVTGGASAAYGTDAVAGVVNFILDTQFTGLKFDVQGGETKYGDNPNGQIDLTWGGRIGDSMHLILSGQYSKENGIQNWNDRPWYRGFSLMTNPAFETNGTLPKLIIAKDVVGTNFTCGGMISAPGTAIDRLQFNNDGTVSPFVRTSLSSLTGTASQSIAVGNRGGSGCDPARQVAPPGGAGPTVTDNHKDGKFFGYYTWNLTDNFQVFAQGLYADDDVGFNGDSSVMQGTWQATIYSGNPFLPAAVQQVMTANNIQSFSFERDNRDLLSNAYTDLVDKTRTGTIGFKSTLNGGFMDGWNVNGYFQRGENKQLVRFMGAIRTQTLNVALDAVRDPATGQIVCHAALVDPAKWGDCVPLNLFGQGNASPEAIRYVTTPTDPRDTVTYHYDLSENDAEISTSGPLYHGWGAGEISGAFGVDYRRQDLRSEQTGPGANASTPTNGQPGIRGLPGGWNGSPNILEFNSYAPINNGFDVKEGFFETLVPLVADKFLVQQLNATASARWADYQGSGAIWAWKYGLDWKLYSDLRLRSTVSRDVRAATLSERFDLQRTNGRITNDPITGKSYNFSQTTGGNPNLDPERADTFTAGFVYEPSWLSGFSTSVDWWSVTIKEAIGQLGTQAIVQDCFQGSPSLCALITRDPTTKLISDVQNIYININKQRSSGIDLEANYARSVHLFGGGPESIRVRALGSWLHEEATFIPGSAPMDLVGQIDAPQGSYQLAYPAYQGTVSVNYQNGPVGLYVQERVIGQGILNPIYVPGVDVSAAQLHVPSVTYTDVRLSYQPRTSGQGRWELFAYVANLFDKAPPIAPDVFSSLGGSVQTNKVLYDVKGQRFLLGVSYRF